MFHSKRSSFASFALIATPTVGGVLIPQDSAAQYFRIDRMASSAPTPPPPQEEEPVNVGKVIIKG